ncbi:hypothetical protein, partial [Clostridium sp.]|uniref:hypothetical protein n=1 Tax=Clostridium sp. TaxID=1506 RepID=UPI003F6689C7
MNKVFLFKSLAKDLGGDNLTEYGYGVYVALRALYNINYTKTLVSLDQIWYTLTGKVEKIPRRQKDNLIKG